MSDRERILHYKHPELNYEQYEAELRKELANLQKYMEEHDGDDGGFSEYAQKVDRLVLRANEWISPFELLPIQHLPKSAMYRRDFLELGKKIKRKILAFIKKDIIDDAPYVVIRAKEAKRDILYLLKDLLEKKLVERMMEAKRLKEQGKDPDSSDNEMSESELSESEMTDTDEVPPSTSTISQVPITQKKQVSVQPIVGPSKSVSDDKQKPIVNPGLPGVLTPAPYFPGESVENSQANRVLRQYNELIKRVSPDATYFYLTEGVRLSFQQMQILFCSRYGKNMAWLDDDTIVAWFQLLQNRSHILSNAKRINDHSGFDSPLIEYVPSAVLAAAATGGDPIRLDVFSSKQRAVLIPSNVNDNHWILYVWQPYEHESDKRKSTRVYLYDSMTGDEKGWKQNFLRNVAPYIRYGTERLNTFITNETIDLDYVTPFVQGAKYKQKYSCECGYMLCWFANLISMFGIETANQWIKTYMDVGNLNNFIRTMITSFGIGYCYKKPLGFDEETLSVTIPDVVPMQAAPTPTPTSAPIPTPAPVSKEARKRITPINPDSDIIFPDSGAEVTKKPSKLSESDTKVAKKRLKPSKTTGSDAKDAARIRGFKKYEKKWRKRQRRYDKATAGMTQEQIDELEADYEAELSDETDEEGDVDPEAEIDLSEEDDV